MASRKNFPDRVEARRLSAAARSEERYEGESALIKVETELSKQDEITTKTEGRLKPREYKMWALFLATALMVTVARQVTGKSSSSEATISYFCQLYFINVVGLGVVCVISTATISRFHRYFLGKKYDGQEPKVGDLTPSFFYLLVFALVVSILAILGAYATPSDWQG